MIVPKNDIKNSIKSTNHFSTVKEYQYANFIKWAKAYLGSYQLPTMEGFLRK